MRPIRETILMASQVDNDLIVMASLYVSRARAANDPGTRQQMFEDAFRLRRIAEIAGAVTRDLEDRQEATRVPTPRENLGAVVKLHRKVLRLVSSQP